MWGSSEEPPGTMEVDTPESVVDVKDTCEQGKTQLESVKDIMLRNKQTLKKKEEELQKYAKRLSKFKNRAKKSRSNQDNEMSSTESTPTSTPDTRMVEPVDDVDDISQAKTPKAKSSLLQKKLAEDRKIFQQRSKELTESKRAVEEKVEALRQQFEEKYVTPVSVSSSSSVTSQTHSVTELNQVQDKDNKIAELSNKIFELEAVIIDLQDNLKEKDSVIDSKIKAITLMSENLSKKGKTALDSLEDTKDEMRSMQENFVLVETSLRNKNDILLKQLEEKTQQLSTLEEDVHSLTDKLEAQKQVESVNADFSRSTMDTLVDTKDAMKSMQENFVLIESSLKSKNENLLQQLEEREMKLAEAEVKILNLETGKGIERQPHVEELSYKVEKLEEMNHSLLDEKYELQKLIANLQDKIISNEFSSDGNVLVEKDNRIVELEHLIKELQISNQTMEENKMNLEKQVLDLNKKNEEMSVKVIDFEKQVLDLENEKDEYMKLNVTETKVSVEDDKVQKLTRELEELNKSMIKMKANNKNKLKNMRQQLNNFMKVSDTNAELVKLGNQVALLEEEKASAGECHERISSLEGKVTDQAKEILAHIEAIAILENQKLDLIQDLHATRQEISSLEAENAESENLRVTAEMKVVDLEEKLESLQRQTSAEPLNDSERVQLQHQIETLNQDNERLTQKIGKLEELKSSSEVGSTDSFVKTGSNVDSTESFEALAADADRAELLKRIDGLARENSALLEKLTRYEEKGSSDTGSTESFERIPEAGEEAAKLEILTRENYELSAKVTRLEEKLAIVTSGQQSEFAHTAASQRSQPTPEVRPDEEPRPEESSSLASSAPVVAELPLGMAAEWESNELRKPIEGELPSTHWEACAKEASVAVEEHRSALVALERKCENCEALITEQKTIIEELRTRLANNEVELVAELRSELESKDEELRTALLVKDKLRDEFEALRNNERAAEEHLSTTRQELVDLGNKLNAYAEEQRQLLDRLAERQVLVEQLEAKLDLEGKLLRERLEEEERKVADLLEDKRGQEEARGSVEKQLLDLEVRHEESLQHAANVSAELHQTYKSLELLKLKHTEDMLMLNRRLEDVIEELQVRTQENTSLESELLEKSSALEKCVPETVKISLETKLEEMEKKAQEQLEKLKKYALAVKKKTAQCDELEAKLTEFEDKWSLEKSEKEIRNTELRESLLNIQLKDNKIADLEEKLQRLQTAQDEALREVETVKAELIEARDKDNKIADMTEELQFLHASRNEALRQIEIAKVEANEARQKDNKIADLEEKLHNLQISKDEVLDELQQAKVELIDATEKDSKIADMTAELQHLQSIKDEALLEVDTVKMKLNEVGRKDNRIADLEEELHRLKVDRDQILKDFEIAKMEMNETREQISRITDMQEELQRVQTDRDVALLKIEVNCEVIRNKDVQIAEMENVLYRYQSGQESCDEIKKLKAESEEAELKKDKTIADMSEEIRRLQLAKEEALHEAEVAKAQLNELKEKDKMIAELKQELKSLQSARDEALHELEVVKEELNEVKDTLNSLSEVKDKARELGVRMEVMEAEYVEQLGQINSLRAENGLLLSKQAQVNERLENVEKESEERRAQLEKLEKEQLIAETRRSETVDGTCGHCSARLQALEAMLQERDAEIENLDNELHNSIGNLVQMQEHLRMSTVSSVATHDAAAQESYDELAHRYNILMSQSEEVKIKYEATLRQNEDLLVRVAQLHDINATLQARLESGEKELMERSKEQDQESSIVAQGLEQSRSSRPDLISGDGWELESSTSLINAEAQQQELTSESVERQKREAPPPLFDASVFGTLSPQADSSVDWDSQVNELKTEVASLNEQLTSERVTVAFLNQELEKLRTSRSETYATLDSANIDEVERVNQPSHTEDLEREQQTLKDKCSQLLSELEALKADNEELLAQQDAYKSRLVEVEAKLSVDDNAKFTELEDRIARLVSERDLLQLQVNDVMRAFDEHRNSTEVCINNLREQLEASTRERNQFVKELEDHRDLDKTASASIKQEVTPDSMWEDEEDPWGLNDKAIPHSSEQHVDIPVVPSATIQLQLRVDELEEQLKDLREEKVRLVEESKNVQIKNVKCVMKLKEYKLQLNSLQQQLKSQRSTGSFGADLDSAIEEELKAQLDNLGKALAEAREESRKALIEKENLMKRIDVLTSVSERFTDAKEKQDAELHIWQMRYKELEGKLQQMDLAVQTRDASSSPTPESNTALISKYEEEIKEAKSHVEILMKDKEQLSADLDLLEDENRALRYDADRHVELRNHLQKRELEVKRLTEELQNCPNVSHMEVELQDAKENLKRMELSVEEYVTKLEEQNEEIRALREAVKNAEAALVEKDQFLTALHSQLEEHKMQLYTQEEGLELLRQALTKKEREFSKLSELHDLRNEEYTDSLNKLIYERNILSNSLSEKDALMQESNDKLEAALLEQKNNAKEEAAIVQSNNEDELQRLRDELVTKSDEIERLQDWISSNSTTGIIQNLQDNINELYNEKSALEERLASKSQEIDFFKLQNELQSRDQELIKLQQVVNERELQLKEALERGADDADDLGAELREKQHQLENLKFTVAELQSEVASLRALEGLAAEDRATIDRLRSEKELVRRDAQEAIERILKEKEDEIDAVKRQLADENASLTEALGLRGRDLENLKLQIEQTSLDKDSILEQRNQMARLETELSERERRLAELSITKDTEIHNMQVQLSEKNARLEELLALSEEEKRQLAELRNLLEAKELQITELKKQLAEKITEFELMQHALHQRHVINSEQQQTPSQVVQHQQLQRSPSEVVGVESTASSSSTDELDLALYMLHQRDVRCEELTHELMQLLEERDTLQLRLSNAIRVNEELRKYKTGTVLSSPKRNISPTEETAENAEPLVQNPSPSHSEGPIEIAKEAINSSIIEDKKALAQKLLQLKSVDQGRDVRLRDERELRHAQQMSLLSHGDVLSTLPPEAAARLVNANYTLSRDVQSQSSVLMNWLWGKSTPKIVHM